MGGAKSLLGARGTPTTGLVPRDEGTRVPLDEALSKLETRGGPFMSGLIAKLRLQAQKAAAPPATNLGGTERGTVGTGLAHAIQPLRTGFLGGY